jgi:8-oxo-dGTP diphosphatase
MEPGEDVYSALKRELREETRLDVEIERLIGLYSDPRYQIVRYPGGRAVHFVTSLFSCRLRGGRLEGSNEGMAWEWFAPEGLPEPLLPYAEVWLCDALSDQARTVVR